MKNPLKTETSAGLGLLAARVPMGMFFLIAGYGKFTGSGGVSGFVSQSRSGIPGWISPQLGHYYLGAVPYLEVIVGAFLVLGLLTRLVGLIGALMITSFIIGATGIRGNGLPFSPNLIYLGLLLLVFLVGPGKLSVDALLFGGRRRGAA